jgi:tRNA threonylcarbamoyladenosine biosynthesis protein TsaE
LQKIFDLKTSEAEETHNFGFEFSKQLSPGSIICFYGDLGAGKTTCIKGICAGLGVSQPVTSPTFTLINEYNGRLPIYHFDFYRIGSSNETFELGLDEYFFGEGVCLIEWPDVINELLPPNRFEFHLKWDFSDEPNVRIIKAFST